MRLSANFGAAIVSLLFLMSMVGMRADMEGEFVREYNAPLYMAPPPDPDTLAAFPGAFGKAAQANQTARDSVINGSWDVQVFKVTSLDDTGDGTLRAILEDSIDAGAYNIVVPDTFGTISCASQINVKDASFAGATGTSWWGRAAKWGFYFAGQAGPGGGLALEGCTMKLAENSLDMVFRYLRFQYQDDGSNISFEGGERLYFDHITNRWGDYLNFNISGDTAGTAGCPAKDCPLDGLTIANSMIYDADYPRDGISLCSITGGDPEDNEPLHNVLYYQNYHANCTQRTPSIGGDSLWVVNGIWYNIRRENGHFAEDATGDYIGNYGKRGAYSATTTRGYMLPWEYDNPWGNVSLYAASNRHTRNGMNSATPADSAWRGSKRIIAYYATTDTVTEGDSIPLSLKRDTPLSVDYHPFTEHTPTDAWRDSLMAVVGMSRKVDSLGNWTLVTSTGANVRDTYDSIRAANFADSVSFWVPNLDTDTVTIPTIAAGAAIGDTDSDGLPDAYELRVTGSTTALPADSVAPNYGYLAIEMYLAGLHFDAVPGGGASPVPPTYVDGRIAYLVPVVLDTVITRDTLGAVVDTFIARRPDSDSIEAGTLYRAILVASRDSAVLLTYDTMNVPVAGAQDSAAVDSILADWGLTYPPYPWAVTVPGQP